MHFPWRVVCVCVVHTHTFLSPKRRQGFLLPFCIASGKRRLQTARWRQDRSTLSHPSWDRGSTFEPPPSDDCLHARSPPSHPFFLPLPNPYLFSFKERARMKSPESNRPSFPLCRHSAVFSLSCACPLEPGLILPVSIFFYLLSTPSRMLLLLLLLYPSLISLDLIWFSVSCPFLFRKSFEAFFARSN